MTERRYSVVWTEVASRDVERLASYLVDEAPLRAEQMLERIISRGESLEILRERAARLPSCALLAIEHGAKFTNSRGESSTESRRERPSRSTACWMGDEAWKTS